MTKRIAILIAATAFSAATLTWADSMTGAAAGPNGTGAATSGNPNVYSPATGGTLGSTPNSSINSVNPPVCVSGVDCGGTTNPTRAGSPGQQAGSLGTTPGNGGMGTYPNRPSSNSNSGSSTLPVPNNAPNLNNPAGGVTGSGSGLGGSAGTSGGSVSP